jgi:surface antigen
VELDQHQPGADAIREELAVSDNSAHVQLHPARTSPTRWIILLVAVIATIVLATFLAPVAASADSTQDAAVSWAGQEAAAGDTSYDGLCLQFVHDAYSQAGYDINPVAGDTSSAVSYWNSYSGPKYGDTNPPAGALVFWDATSTNPYGHVAISEGNGHAYSSEERSYTGVHDLTIEYRNEQGYPYLGYIVVG